MTQGRWWARTKVRWRRWRLLLQTRVGSLSDITLCLVSVSSRRGGSSSYFHLLRVCIRARAYVCFDPPRTHTFTILLPFSLPLTHSLSNTHTRTHIHAHIISPTQPRTPRLGFVYTRMQAITLSPTKATLLPTIFDKCFRKSCQNCEKTCAFVLSDQKTIF